MTNSQWELQLLGCWQLKRDGQPVDIGIRQQRLIAALALLGPRSRRYLTGLLWPDSTDAQAAGSLRTTVFRITHEQPGLLEGFGDSLRLAPGVPVDTFAVRQVIDDVARGDFAPAIGCVDLLRNADLLPGWYEDWVVFEQEQLTQQRVHCLEALGEYLLQSNDVARALEAAHAAASIEPLRESAQLLILKANLKAGNNVRAMKSFEDFHRKTQSELGVAPSSRFRDLLQKAN